MRIGKGIVAALAVIVTVSVNADDYKFKLKNIHEKCLVDVHTFCRSGARPHRSTLRTAPFPPLKEMMTHPSHDPEDSEDHDSEDDLAPENPFLRLVSDPPSSPCQSLSLLRQMVPPPATFRSMEMTPVAVRIRVFSQEQLDDEDLFVISHIMTGLMNVASDRSNQYYQPQYHQPQDIYKNGDYYSEEEEEEDEDYYNYRDDDDDSEDEDEKESGEGSAELYSEDEDEKESGEGSAELYSEDEDEKESGEGSAELYSEEEDDIHLDIHLDDDIFKLDEEVNKDEKESGEGSAELYSEDEDEKESGEGSAESYSEDEDEEESGEGSAELYSEDEDEDEDKEESGEGSAESYSEEVTNVNALTEQDEESNSEVLSSQAEVASQAEAEAQSFEEVLNAFVKHASSASESMSSDESVSSSADTQSDIDPLFLSEMISKYGDLLLNEMKQFNPFQPQQPGSRRLSDYAPNPNPTSYSTPYHCAPLNFGIRDDKCLCKAFKTHQLSTPCQLAISSLPDHHSSTDFDSNSDSDSDSTLSVSSSGVLATVILSYVVMGVSLICLLYRIFISCRGDRANRTSNGYRAFGGDDDQPGVHAAYVAIPLRVV